VVRHTGDRYQLIAGERVARRPGSGAEVVPVRVVDFNDQQAFEATLVENIQRADLNPIEKALGFKEYLERFRSITSNSPSARPGAFVDHESRQLAGAIA